MSDKFFLVDAHSYLYQAFFAIRGLTDPAGEPVNAVYGFARMLQKLIKDYNPDYLAVATDLPGKVFRHEIYEDYKATRKPMPEALVRQIPLAYEMLEKYEIPLLTADNYEADDVMASAAKQASKEGLDAVLVTTDKDVEQVIDEKISVLHIHKNKEIVLDVDGLRKKHGIEPWQVVEMMSLAGDSSDNIPGVPGIGPKTALKLLKQFRSVDNLYENIDKVSSDSIKTKLQKNHDLVRLSRRLVTVETDLPLEIDYESCRLSDAPPETALRFFQALGFRSLADGAKTQRRNKKSHQGMLFDNSDAETDSLGVEPENIDSVENSYQVIRTLDGLRSVLEKIKDKKVFAIDLETTSLDPHEAELVGVALSWRAHQGVYAAMKGPEGEEVCPLQESLNLLKDILDNPRVGKVGQNLKYDIMVLKSYGLNMKGVVCDTMVASHLLNPSERSHSLEALSLRCLNYRPVEIEELVEGEKNKLRMDKVSVEKVTRYACEDADLAYRLYELLYPELKGRGLLEVLKKIELPLIHVLADMEWLGIKINRNYLEELGREFDLALQDLQKKIYYMAGTEFNINSPQQLSEVLFQRLKLPVPKGKKRNTGYSTDQKVLTELAAEHEIADDLLRWRRLSKLKSTYADALVEIVNSRTGRLHTSFNQTGTATGRLSSSDPNLQNIPIRTSLGRRIRRAFVPSEPWMSFLSADYSQVELRVLAHCSGDKTLQDAFRADRDIHRFVAAQVYGIDETEVNEQMRGRAKAVNFGIVYGQTAYGLSRSLKISTEEAQTFIDEYFDRYPNIRKFINHTVAGACNNGYVKTLGGRMRPITGLGSEGVVRNAAERVAVNTVIQGSAADLIKIAMINIHRKLGEISQQSNMLIQIHDELLFEVPDDEMADVKTFVNDQMREAMKLSVPLKVDLVTGKNWEQAK